MDEYQLHNGKQVLTAVQERTHNQGWEKKRARRMARMCIICCLTESDLYNFASGKIPESLRLPHDPGKVGWDHYSVGVFQQQPTPYIDGGGWGKVADCQDPKKSAHKFMGAAASKGVDNFNGRPMRLNIQAVQVSYDPGGWNYARNWVRGVFFVRKHWNFDKKQVK